MNVHERAAVQSRIRWEAGARSEYTRFVGFDVSAATIAVAVAAPGRTPAVDAGVLAVDTAAVRKGVMRQPDRGTLLTCYEAGPTGYGLQRQLTALGVACQVIAPGLVPTRPTDRLQTDRRDARHWADALRAGTLTPVRVPTEAEEAFRDWVRARTMAVQVRQRARQRVKSTLLRWGLRPPAGRAAWGPAYRAWLRPVTPTPTPRDPVWVELLSQLEEADTRVDRITRQIAATWPTHPLAPLMRAWQGLRGIDWLTAAIAFGVPRRPGRVRSRAWRRCGARQLMALTGGSHGPSAARRRPTGPSVRGRTR